MPGGKTGSVEGIDSPTKADLQARIEALEPWFHYLELDGIPTKTQSFIGENVRYPEHLWGELEPFIPTDLTGKSVLDIGCNGGFFSVKAAERGGSVTGLDINTGADFVGQSRLVAEVLSLDARFEEADFHDWTDGPYDLVLCLGVLYHLEHPYLGIQQLAELTRDRLVLETLSTHPGDSMRFTGEHGYQGDTSTYWDPGKECVDSMLRASGFKLVDGRHDGQRYQVLAERTRDR